MTYIDGLSLEQLLNIVSSKEEMQAIFFVGLCCLGAWVVLSWLIQLIRSILWIWPLLLVVAILIAVPSLRITVTQEMIPKQVDGIIHLLDKKYNDYNNETFSWYS
ncbi:unnamed protein product [Tenebrio molitor]|nr:unnamed protein product [Tenebrio molitor]